MLPAPSIPTNKAIDSTTPMGRAMNQMAECCPGERGQEAPLGRLSNAVASACDGPANDASKIR